VSLGLAGSGPLFFGFQFNDDRSSAGFYRCVLSLRSIGAFKVARNVGNASVPRGMTRSTFKRIPYQGSRLSPRVLKSTVHNGRICAELIEFLGSSRKAYKCHVRVHPMPSSRVKFIATRVYKRSLECRCYFTLHPHTFPRPYCTVDCLVNLDLSSSARHTRAGRFLSETHQPGLIIFLMNQHSALLLINSKQPQTKHVERVTNFFQTFSLNRLK